MGLDPVLLEVLRCPCDKHAPVTVAADDSVVVCTECARSFPIRDDIPVMLLDEATPGPDNAGPDDAGTA